MATQTPQLVPVSLRPSAFAQGGGLVDDADLTISKARFISTNYGGKSDNDVVVLNLTLTDDEGADFEQMYSCGNGFVPAETGDDATQGTFLVPVGDKTAPSGSSNFALMLTSLINTGLPEDLLDSGYINELEGFKGHWNRVPAPKRGNLPSRAGQDPNRVATILLCTTVIHLPGEAPKAAAKGKAAPATKAAPKAAAGKPAAAAPAATDLTDEIAGVLMGAFAEAGIESAPKVKLVQMLFKAVEKTDPNRQAMMSAVGKEETLMALPGFEFDGSILKLA